MRQSGINLTQQPSSFFLLFFRGIYILFLFLDVLKKQTMLLLLLLRHTTYIYGAPLSPESFCRCHSRGRASVCPQGIESFFPLPYTHTQAHTAGIRFHRYRSVCSLFCGAFLLVRSLFYGPCGWKVNIYQFSYSKSQSRWRTTATAVEGGEANNTEKA